MVDAPAPARAEYAAGKILAEVTDGVGLITFNQPEKRNAMSFEMWEGLATVLHHWESDDGVRVVVLTGAGDKAFVSGADISQFGEKRSNAEAQRAYDAAIGPARASLANYRKPVVARIRGFCLGGGLGIAMMADIRIASDDSTFGIPAARLGVAYSMDSIQQLTALVGPANARLLLFSGDRIDAAEAKQIGLVNRVVPAEALVGAVANLARTIAGNAPLSVNSMKLIVEQTQRDPAERDTAAAEAAVAACFDSADYTEGRTAFMEKRRPVFQGR